MVAGVKKLAGTWRYDAVSIGYPGAVARNRPVAEPHNLGPGWVSFDFQAAFGCPAKVINDAAMQALGSYDGGNMLFLGLGTGLGTTMIVEGIVVPMEVGHLPYRRATFEDYVGWRGLERLGKKQWRRHVTEVIELLRAALLPDEIVLGGGNADKVRDLPPACRLGDNANAFAGGFRLWATKPARKPIARLRTCGNQKSRRAENSKMNAAIAPVTARKAWRLLEKERRGLQSTVAARALCRGSCARRTPDRRGRGCLPRLFEAPRHRRDAAAAVSRSPSESGLARSASTRCSAARRSTSRRTGRCCTSRCARREGTSIVVDGENVVPGVHAVLDRMADFADARSRRRRGRATPASASATSSTSASAAPISGPVMAYEALRHYSERSLTFRFVSNVDGTDFAEAIARPRSRRDALHRLVEDLHHARRR